MLLGQATNSDGPSGLALVGLMAANLLGWVLFVLVIWRLFRRISRWQNNAERSDTEHRRTVVAVSVKLAALVLMVFSGYFVLVSSESAIRGWPTLLFCGSELLIWPAILYWIWRDFDPEVKAEPGATPNTGRM